MELHAVGALEAERLVRVRRRAARRTAPSGRSKVSPCHCRVTRSPSNSPNTGSARPSSVRSTGSRPTSGSVARIDTRAERRGEQLHPEADAPVGRSRSHGLADRAASPSVEPGQLRVVVRGHRPAHGHDGVELAPVGKRLALVELDAVQLDAALAQDVLEDAGRLAGDVLQDQDAHEPTLDARAGGSSRSRPSCEAASEWRSCRACRRSAACRRT